MRTITKRKIEALGWFDDGDRQTTGLIKVHTRLELGPGEPDPGKTQYFVGTILKSDKPYKDALKIIETGEEITEKQAKEIMEEKYARN